MNTRPEVNRENLERLPAGAVLRKGDYLLIHERFSRVTRCKYDPGCCVGRTIEGHERYYRERSTA